MFSLQCGPEQCKVAATGNYVVVCNPAAEAMATARYSTQRTRKTGHRRPAMSEEVQHAEVITSVQRRRR
jgi:hypothetical protein